MDSWVERKHLVIGPQTDDRALGLELAHQAPWWAVTVGLWWVYIVVRWK